MYSLYYKSLTELWAVCNWDEAYCTTPVKIRDRHSESQPWGLLAHSCSAFVRSANFSAGARHVCHIFWALFVLTIFSASFLCCWSCSEFRYCMAFFAQPYSKRVFTLIRSVQYQKYCTPTACCIITLLSPNDIMNCSTYLRELFAMLMTSVFLCSLVTILNILPIRAISG